MSESERFSKDEILRALEFDIKQFRRKHEYHSSLAQDYLQRAEELEKEMIQIKMEQNK